jgi:phage protein U
MTRPLFQLGSFQFDLPNGAPQTLDWNADYRWEEQGRLLRDPAQQFIGPGSQTITLDGVLYPGFSGRQSTMEQLRGIARAGEPLMFTDGLGRVFGKWAIKQLREGKSTFAPGGGARQIDFSIQLVFYGEDNPGQAASPLSVQPSSALAGLTSAVSQAANFTGAGSAFAALDWSQTLQFQGLTQQATASGFNLGQLAGIASTGASIASQISSGDYVNTALGTFGMLGVPVAQQNGWAQIGINGANLAQAYLTGKGPTAMALALDAAAVVGAPAMQQLGLVAPENLQAVSSLLRSAATVSELLRVDPKTTDALRPLITITGG